MREALLTSIAAALIAAAAGIGARQPEAAMATMISGQSMALRRFLCSPHAEG